MNEPTYSDAHRLAHARVTSRAEDLVLQLTSPIVRAPSGIGPLVTGIRMAIDTGGSIVPPLEALLARTAADTEAGADWITPPVASTLQAATQALEELRQID